MRKARFESRDVASSEKDRVLSPKKNYTGKERRRACRRVSGDRRQEIRFDLNGSDRRANLGRRHEDRIISTW